MLDHVFVGHFITTSNRFQAEVVEVSRIGNLFLERFVF